MQAALLHASPAEQLKQALRGPTASGAAMRPARLLYHLEVPQPPFPLTLLSAVQRPMCVLAIACYWMSAMQWKSVAPCDSYMGA